jgi:hypothetical protein
MCLINTYMRTNILDFSLKVTLSLDKSKELYSFPDYESVAASFLPLLTLTM